MVYTIVLRGNLSIFLQEYIMSNVKNSPVVASKVIKPSKVVHPDGTVFYRSDRNKWIACYGGKQEAARDTKEKCLAFLKKKYNVQGVVLE